LAKVEAEITTKAKVPVTALLMADLCIDCCVLTATWRKILNFCTTLYEMF